MLVTGGAGFIGSNLAEALADPESSVYDDTPSLPNIENMPAEYLKSCAHDRRMQIVIDRKRVVCSGHEISIMIITYENDWM